MNCFVCGKNRATMGIVLYKERCYELLIHMKCMSELYDEDFDVMDKPLPPNYKYEEVIKLY